MKNIGFGITGSFCTHEKILPQLENLVAKGYNVIPILSEVVVTTNTRFGLAKDFVSRVEKVTGNKAITSIVEAEPVGPKNMIDIMVIAPCTGNTLSKLANAISDNAITMVTKSHVRNNKPVVVGVSTNDALGFSMCNLSKLMNSKNFYFVPFMQDDFEKKPKSLVSDWSQLEETIEHAMISHQIQPIIKRS